MLENRNGEAVTPWICLISRLSTLFAGREMVRLGFGSGQFFFLAELFAEEGLSQDELSRRVGVDKSNTSRAIDKLEKYGLICRKADPENHRIKKIYLEPRAHDIRNEFYDIQQKWNAVITDGLSEENKNRLLADLKDMAGRAEAFFKLEGVYTR